MTETPLAVEFDGDSLATVGRVTFSDEGDCSGHLSTAHPQVDRGKAYNIVTRFGKDNMFVAGVVSLGCTVVGWLSGRRGRGSGSWLRVWPTALRSTSPLTPPPLPPCRYRTPHAQRRYVIFEVDQDAPPGQAGAGRSDRTIRRRLLAEIPRQRPSYMHSFGITERYIVLSEWAMRSVLTGLDAV